MVRLDHIVKLNMQQPAEVILGSTDAAAAQQPSVRPLPLSLLVIDADRAMTEMESVFRRAGDNGWTVEALAVLRGWEVDPMLDRALRARAKGLVWKFQPRGWDEV